MKQRKRANRRYNNLIFLLLLVCLSVAAAVLLSGNYKSAAPSGVGGYEAGAQPGSSHTETPYELDISDYPEKLQELYWKNPDARQFVLDYFENLGREQQIDLSGEVESGTVPLLMQWDQRWGYSEYSGNLMGLSGCGPTCLSMAAIYLLDDPTLHPLAMAEFSTDHGCSTQGDGTSWSLFSDACTDLGLTSRELPLNRGDIDSALEDGQLVVCILGPGDFTDSGHFILLTGISDGEYTVNDPNSYERSAKTWSFEDLSPQVRNIWALGT